MDLFCRSDLRELLAKHDGPCVSMFMPTHRGGAEADPIRLRRLLVEAGERLCGLGMPKAEVREYLSPWNAELEDVSFWPNQCDGLAGFLAHGFQRLFRLPMSFQEGIHVGDLFQVTPLLPLLQGDGRFFVLALSQNGVRLLQGTRWTISPVDLKRAPKSLAEAMLFHDKDEPLTFHSRPTSGGTWGAIFSGHGVGIDDEKDDLLRFFQRIDRSLRETLGEERAPLIVAAVEYLVPIYRQANQYRDLIDLCIPGNPDQLTDQELHERAWKLVEPFFQARLQDDLATYRQAVGTGRATAELDEIIPAAVRGEVQSAFIADGQHIWGNVDAGSHLLTIHDQPEPGDEDLLNLAAIRTLEHGNSVYMLPREQMPTTRPIAGIYHLPLTKRGRRP